jgi:hypothetical protein
MDFLREKCKRLHCETKEKAKRVAIVSGYIITIGTPFVKEKVLPYSFSISHRLQSLKSE